MLRLQHLQWKSREELDRRTLHRLRSVLEHAASAVPFYRDLFARARVDPEDVTTLSALSRLPVVTKDDLRAGFPERTTAADVPASRRWLTRTSGSTGRPFEFYADRAGMDSWLGSHLFFLDWIGAAIWTPRIDIFGPPGPAVVANIPGASGFPHLVRSLGLGERVIHIAGADLTLEGFQACLDRLPRRWPYFIRANPAYAARLAAQLRAADAIRVPDPIAVMTGAETLTPAHEAAIRAAFHCLVVNHYSAWEVPHMAQSCPDNRALLHVNSERVVLRVVDGDGYDVEPGERGRVVVTALANDAMPFINYDLGDWAVAGGPCPCGRGLPTLSAIEGRGGSMMLTPEGRAITPGLLTNHLTFNCAVVSFLSEYQAEQTASAAMIFRIVPAPGFARPMVTTLQESLERLVGPRVAVSVDVVDWIAPEPSGKRPIIKVRQAAMEDTAPPGGDSGARSG